MPYLKSNWSSMPPLDEFGRFAFGEIFTIPEMTLTRTDPTSRACYLHVALEHQGRVQELDIVCDAPTIVVNFMRGQSTTSMTYTYLTTMKGTASESYPGCYSYRIDSSLLSHVEIWQLQIKYLFPRIGETTLHIKRISVIVEDPAKRRELNHKAESTQGRKGVLDRPTSNALHTYYPPPTPPPPQPFSTESAVMIGLVVVDQVLGVMSKEIQENLEATCKGVEGRLLADLASLENKMRKIEEAYEDLAADIRLHTISESLSQLVSSRGFRGHGEVDGRRITWEGGLPIIVNEEEEEQVLVAPVRADVMVGSDS